MNSRFFVLIFVLDSLLLLQCLQLTIGHVNKMENEHIRFLVKQEGNPGMVPELNVFFHHKDLKQGNQMKVYFPFPNKDPSTSPHLLSKHESDTIPFASSGLNYLLALFSIAEGSKQAHAVQSTLHQCEYPPLNGETKFCSTSLEHMLDSVREMFGSRAHLKVLTTNYLTESISPLQNYTIYERPFEIKAPKIVACHLLPYPYAVFYCHSQVSDDVLYKVMLEGEDEARVEAMAMCHMDTSEWDPDHVAFRVLGTSPGGGPVCHFFPADNLVWIPGP